MSDPIALELDFDAPEAAFVDADDHVAGGAAGGAGGDDAAAELSGGEEDDGAGKAEEEEVADGDFVISKTNVVTAEFMAVKPWIGAIVAPSGWSASQAPRDVPDETLVMERVHGYRCRGVYDNLHYNAEGMAVFPAAAVGIIMNPSDGSQQFFRSHVDDILSLAVDPTRKLAASGSKASIDLKRKGELPRLYVWNAITGQEICEIRGAHKSAISAVAFSPDSRFVASVGADNNHLLAVHNASTGKLIAQVETGTDRIIGLGWNPVTGILVTVGVNHITFWEFNGTTFGRPRKGIVGTKGSRCTHLCVAFTPRHTWTGTQDGAVYVWAANTLASAVNKVHSGRVNAIGADLNYVVTGGADGLMRVFTHAGKHVLSLTTIGAPIRSIAIGADSRMLVGTSTGSVLEVERFLDGDASPVVGLQQGHFDGELWGLAVSPYDQKFLTAGDDNLICMWDAITHERVAARIVAEKGVQVAATARRGDSTMSQFAPNQCVRAADWGPNGYIAVACNDGSVHLMDETLNTVCSVKDRKQWIQAIKFDPTGDYLAVGSHDDLIDIYKVEGDALVRHKVLKGHSSFITHLDWTDDGLGLQSTCGAYELLFWDPIKGTQNTHGATVHRDQRWATWTAPLGWPVQGIWPERADGSDINTVDRSPTADLLAVGDDFQRIRLFRWPAVAKRAPCKLFTGHASHVTSVHFTCDGSRLISTGGNDNTIIVWSVGFDDASA